MRPSVEVRGRPRIYADTAIECALVVKSVFHLSLRATQGFMGSVVKLMDVELPVPDCSTGSRRQAGLEVRLGVTPRTEPRHVVIDTTGLKVYGAGERYMRKYGLGRGRRRVNFPGDQSLYAIRISYNLLE